MTKKTLTDIPMDIFMKHIFIYAFASESPPIYKKSYLNVIKSIRIYAKQ